MTNQIPPSPKGKGFLWDKVENIQEPPEENLKKACFRVAVIMISFAIGWAVHLFV